MATLAEIAADDARVTAKWYAYAHAAELAEQNRAAAHYSQDPNIGSHVAASTAKADHKYAEYRTAQKEANERAGAR